MMNDHSPEWPEVLTWGLNHRIPGVELVVARSMGGPRAAGSVALRSCRPA